ncbi:MAG TPA: cytochrome P450 [Acidimicrobiia bacterium]|nr:cytochrome P450 [Acidimicrobiia bacterium]
MTDTTAVDVDVLLAEIFLTPEGKSDPYPRYAAIREHSPVFRSAIGFVVVGRYEDCQWVLRDARFGKGEIGAVWESYGLTQEQWFERFGDIERRTTSMLGMDPPDHTRLRRLVAKAFTPKTVTNLVPDIVRLTDELLDRCDGVIDIISALALPLPMAVIGEMLGIPASERAMLQPYVRAAVKMLELNPSLDQLDAANSANKIITDHLESLIAERRAAPTDDLLSQLVHVEEQGDQLSHGELISTVMLLFGAGFETTTNLIGNGLLALLDHPGEIRRLRDDRSLMKTAIEELLRWDSPVQIDGRKVFEDVEVHGTAVAAGEEIVTLLGAANRDPRAFEEPDHFDVGRFGQAPMSFGGGIHYCLGAALARAEGQVVFDRLLDRFAVIEPAWGDERPRYRDSIVLHGLESLPVRLSTKN